ncbi:MAG: hypothetical protein QXJ68_06445 [Methanocellales archaeon]
MNGILTTLEGISLVYKIYGLEYLGRKVQSKNKNLANSEAKRFVILKVTDKMPTKEEVIAAAQANPRVKKAWVMQMEGNKWRKVMDKMPVNV